MQWAQLLWVALGGALGAMSRFAVSGWINAKSTAAYPFGTLAVNVLGSFLFGLLFVAVFSTVPMRESLRLFILVGFLGAFTTFSTFSFETLRLIEEGQLWVAVANVLSSCLLCLLGVWLGTVIARNLL
ncbi:MAG: fluoride efflux transporter CrcB [Pseudomonadales bacterium]|nr:fluoride efflux transporter CrcB [Pseudomonadales bacterium]